MATGTGVSSFQDIAIPATGSLEITMHPLGLYIAITDGRREQDWVGAQERPARFARVDATPIPEPDRAPVLVRLATVMRRLVGSSSIARKAQPGA